jgi:hypothetical protein
LSGLSSILGHATTNPETYFNTLIDDELREKRNKMVSILEKINLPVYLPDAGYFLVVDTSKYINKNEDLQQDNTSWDVKCTVFLKKIN